MKELPLVSIISVNYRNPADTVAFLQSIPLANYPHLEVIVVDNAPDGDYSTEFINAFAKVRHIISHENLGFAGANNLGMQQARGDLFYFLNNDTVLDASSIWPLVRRFGQNPLAGAASPRIAYFAQPQMLQYAGLEKMNFFTGRNRMRGHKQTDSATFQQLLGTGYAHGAAMMVPRKVVETTGGMDTRYFLYYEELDWCERIRQAGYQIEVQGQARVLHKASATVKDSPLKTRYMVRNRLLFVQRFAPKWQLPFFWLWFVLVVSPVHLLKLLKCKRYSLLSAFFGGAGSAFADIFRSLFFQPQNKAA